jgi:hypothetical protein
MVPDDEGNPEPVVYTKTKVLTPEEREAKLMRRKWFRILWAQEFAEGLA